VHYRFLVLAVNIGTQPMSLVSWRVYFDD